MTPTDPRPATPAQAGFVDVHYHVGPDAYVRRHTAASAGATYAGLGGWVVLKNHLGSTAAQAWEARRQGLPVSGSIVLNDIAGGLDPRVVEQAVIQHGDDSGLRLIVHLPTATGRAHKSRLARTPAHPLLAREGLRPLTVTDEDGTLRPEVREILRMARDLPLVISTGHADGHEVRLLAEEAVRLDVRLMLNQPANPMTGLTCSDLLDIASAQQVWTEQTALTYLLGYQDWDDFSAVLARVPRVVYSSDLGQTSQMDIEEWRTSSRDWFAKAGLDEARITEIVRDAPLRMLGV
ncbi:hypothetical protein BFF78_29780 [Streptomyces fodineus]|uniref:Amidohydrolase-related domain-containing protein n=1 Tax=Streptomyces fodineus TaxID=1904616 RepID=A0A1D7YGF2_9ACTN|nr:DUF6282 family protein [Streptomyces fodineus]AOR34683.1 hypothetical protein BFF78_29780 [Streptomyces fodineus]